MCVLAGFGTSPFRWSAEHALCGSAAHCVVCAPPLHLTQFFTMLFVFQMFEVQIGFGVTTGRLTMLELRCCKYHVVV